MWKGGYSPKNQNHCLHFFFFSNEFAEESLLRGGGAFTLKKTDEGHLSSRIDLQLDTNLLQS